MSYPANDPLMQTLESMNSLSSATDMNPPAFSSTHIADVASANEKTRDGRKALKPGQLFETIEEESATSTSKANNRNQSNSIDSALITVHTNDHRNESHVGSCQGEMVATNKSQDKLDTNKFIDETSLFSFSSEDKDATTNVSDKFDSFILRNIEPYSGKGDIVSWLEKIDKFFQRNNVGRQARFNSVSLLVEGEAKRRYMKARTNIRSYDDFYEFLLNEYDLSYEMFLPNRSNQTSYNQISTFSVLDRQNKSNDSHTVCSFDSKSKKRTTQKPSFHSNSVANNEVTDFLGENSVRRTAPSTNNISSSFSDPTSNEIRKAIITDLIKNPKTFRGGKDDVRKWLEDLEHLFDVAHIQGSTRLDLISYSLRGDALEWFKNNKASISSWSAFVTEIQRTFTSLFREELAFKKLEAYSQGENQSIQNFYNEVLKLCKEADSNMSDATKLKNLLSKTKPSIQLEVRKQKPTSTTEFLEFARETEELLQLSNVPSEAKNTAYNSQSFSSQTRPTFQSNNKSTFNRSWNRSSYNSFSRYPQNSRSDDRPQSSAPAYPTRADVPFSNTNQKPQNQFGSNQYSSQYSGQRASNTTNNQNNQKEQAPRNTVSRNTRVPQRAANTIDTSSSLLDSEEALDIFSSATCSRCGQFGHETSVCPNF